MYRIPLHHSQPSSSGRASLRIGKKPKLCWLLPEKDRKRRITIKRDVGWTGAAKLSQSSMNGKLLWFVRSKAQLFSPSREFWGPPLWICPWLLERCWSVFCVCCQNHSQWVVTSNTKSRCSCNYWGWTTNQEEVAYPATRRRNLPKTVHRIDICFQEKKNRSCVD